MSTITEPQTTTTSTPPPQTAGLLAAFAQAKEVIAAAKALREAGVRNVDVHSPHPLHGLESVLPGRRSPLPWAALLGAAIGLGGGIWMAWWMNAVDYAFIISGKPDFALAPSVPVAFELAILLAAFAVFGGALGMAGLPRFADRRFRVPAFARATNDRYFVSVETTDNHEQVPEIRDLLARQEPLRIDAIPMESATEHSIPRWIKLTGLVLLVSATLPPILIARARTSTSTVPRLSFISDMDHQPKFKSQTLSPLFADGRSMRPQVEGTIARGDLRDDVRFYQGINPGPDFLPVSAPQEALQDSTTDGSPRDELVNWVTEIPVDIDRPLLERGQERYEIFCATCHGLGGDGDGLVTKRAVELEQGTWVRPTSLHAEPIVEQPDGKLFHTISHGVRKMPGYESQIPVADRWAIVSYLRALQRSRKATIEDVPADIRPTLRELN
jgi:mono/diheme cytochrome c family protein